MESIIYILHNDEKSGYINFQKEHSIKKYIDNIEFLTINPLSFNYDSKGIVFSFTAEIRQISNVKLSVGIFLHYSDMEFGWYDSINFSEFNVRSENGKIHDIILESSDTQKLFQGQYVSFFIGVDNLSDLRFAAVIRRLSPRLPPRHIWQGLPRK